MMRYMNACTITLLFVVQSHAFAPPPTTKHLASVPLMSFNTEQENKESMREDISRMHQEAAQRMEALEHQFEELQALERKHRSQDSINTHTGMEQSFPTSTDFSSLDGMEGTLLHNLQQEGATESSSTTNEAHFPNTMDQSHQHQHSISATSSSTIPRPVLNDHEFLHADLNLLHGSRWKVAWNIGREPGTWMPAEWGTSGTRLRFFSLIEFTDVPAMENDEFFAASATPVLQVKVLSSWAVPVWGDEGRREIDVDATGLYQVAREQGPAGTDLLRFCISVKEENLQLNDVTVAPGRVYGTCGYFATTPHSHEYKEALAKEQFELTQKLEELQAPPMEEQDAGIWQGLDRMRQQWQVRRHLDQVSHKLLRARQQDPEKSLLRISRDGRVSLTKDGGVCCKVHKGVAVEYRILGKMEVGAVEKHNDDADNEATHSLQP